MRYHEPVLRLAVLLPPQTAIEEKFGGLPWGLPAGRWPTCRACEKPQSFLAQFSHHPERLDLGADGRVLFLFQCNHDPGACETWVGGSGANACIVVDPRDLSNEPAKVPSGETVIETEARVVSWKSDDDGVSEADYPAFFDDQAHAELAEEVCDRVPRVTKAGGAPAWVQGAGEGPGEPWRFALQLESTHSFDRPAPTADEVGCTVTREDAAGKIVREEPAAKRPGAPSWIAVDKEGCYSCVAANYGGDGCAYVFVETVGPRTEGWFFWQR